MAKQTIGIGVTANDGTGDALRDAFDKTNDNFTELYGDFSEVAPAKNVLVGGERNNSIGLNEVSGQGALNVVAYGSQMFGVGVAGVDRITDSAFMGNRAAYALKHGNGNVAMGVMALGTAEQSNSNTGVGDSALRRTVPDGLGAGDQNTAIGYAAGQANLTGKYNVAVGSYSYVFGDGAGDNNVFVGGFTAAQVDATSTNAPGSDNIGIGFSSMRYANGCDHNIAIGNQSGLNLQGDNNVFAGRQAGSLITTGSNNLCFGYLAGAVTGQQKADAVNQILIGYNVSSLIDNAVVIGDANIVSTIIRGNVQGCGSLNFTINAIGAASQFTDGAVYRQSNLLVFTAPSGGFEFKNSTNTIHHVTVNGSGLFTVFLAGMHSIRGDLVTIPSATLTPNLNGQLGFERVSDTEVRLVYRGQDGTTRRSSSFTLS